MTNPIPVVTEEMIRAGTEALDDAMERHMREPAVLRHVYLAMKALEPPMRDVTPEIDQALHAAHRSSTELVEVLPAPKERWLPVVGFEGQYEVSDLGRVRSYLRGKTNGRVLKNVPVKGPGTYLGVYLGGRNYTVHRLVLLAFVGPCPPGHEGCHINGVKEDNRLINLRWATAKGNTADRIAHKRQRYAVKDAVAEAAFLCARLREAERDLLDDDFGRQFSGHVIPPLARLESCLAAIDEHDKLFGDVEALSALEDTIR